MDVPEEPLTELDLPSDTFETAQEEPALQEPETITETVVAATTQPLTPKVRYLIKTTKDKISHYQ